MNIKLIILAIILCLLPFGKIASKNHEIKNICEYLGGRSDKDFLGSGSVALVVQPRNAKVLFVQQWRENGLFDWASGDVRHWSPDQMEMKESLPPIGATISVNPTSRKIFITRDDVVGMTLEWENSDSKEITIQASFQGNLPGEVKKEDCENSFLSSTVAYSDKVPQPIHYVLGASLVPQQLYLQHNKYEVSFSITVKPHEKKSLTLFLATATEKQIADKALAHWAKEDDVLKQVRQNWNEWFDSEIPRFECSNPYFQKLYYYRWWSLYTKMIFAKVGHFYYPSPREGTVGYDGVVSYSGACISVDELRWMRNPSWAFSTTQEFFAPENLNQGYLSNHIWDWGIDGDESNYDALGRSVPYQNYAIDAFWGALQLHPEEGRATLKKVWPQFCSNLASYDYLFDIDKDGLYETYPWSNSAGQEWGARHLYFNPIPEIIRNERGRTYAPDGSRSAEDMELMQKIRSSVVTDPNFSWPKTADELYRIYYGTTDHRLATVDQTTYAYKNFCSAVKLAQLMNDSATERRYAKMSERTRNQLLSVMWDEKDSYFYDVNPIDHRLAKVKSATGYYVFWAKIADKKHLPMMKHLFNPATFWTEYAVPSLPLDYEKYAKLQEAGWNYWNYATWPRTTCHVIDGTLWATKTLDPSLRKNAVKLFDRYTRMHFPNGDLNKPNIAERYDPHTAKPFMENLDYNHSSWIDLLLQHVAGITPTDSDEIIINPVDMGWESFSLENIRYREHDIDIVYSKTKGMIVRVDGKVKGKQSKLTKITIKPSTNL